MYSIKQVRKQQRKIAVKNGIKRVHQYGAVCFSDTKTFNLGNWIAGENTAGRLVRVFANHAESYIKK